MEIFPLKGDKSRISVWLSLYKCICKTGKVTPMGVDKIESERELHFLIRNQF